MATEENNNPDGGDDPFAGWAEALEEQKSADDKQACRNGAEDVAQGQGYQNEHQRHMRSFALTEARVTKNTRTG